MTALSHEEVARAVSSHRFEVAIPSFAEAIEWVLPGAAPISGRDSVVAACRQSAEYLAGVTTDFHRFRVVIGEETAVVESLADYVESDGSRSTVSSCDLYDFEGESLVRITSYNVEL